MGCGNCSSGGCGKTDGCSSGGCNRLNTYNWLADMPMSEMDTPYPYIEVSFNQGSRKDFFKKPKSIILDKGDLVVVEGFGGFDIGEVSLTGEIVKLQYSKKGIKTKESELPNVLRTPSEEDIKIWNQNKAKERNFLIRGRKIIKSLELSMKLAEVEIQADGKKATFFYTADDRIDFRELIKRLASEFRLRIEMKQIGSRQEAAKVGGIGSCGRELCCSTWLTDFRSVSTSAARYQNLSINQLKLSGQCGRLKCCLNFELDSYMEALKQFPRNAEKLRTEIGTANLVKTDIFKNLMWYMYEGQSKYIPLSIESVTEILEINKKGGLYKELIAVEIEKPEDDENNDDIKAEYVDVVGQISLKSLERNARKRKNNNSQKNKTNPNQRRDNVNTSPDTRGANTKKNPNANQASPEEKNNRTQSSERPRHNNKKNNRPDSNHKNPENRSNQNNQKTTDSKAKFQNSNSSKPKPHNNAGINPKNTNTTDSPNANSSGSILQKADIPQKEHRNNRAPKPGPKKGNKPNSNDKPQNNSSTPSES